MDEKVAIIGGGSWGTAIAHLLAENNKQVLIYLRDSMQAEMINKNNVNQKYFPDHKLSPNIRATVDLEEAIKFSSIIFMAVPTSSTRFIMEKIQTLLTRDHVLISTAKGIEEDTFLRNSEIIKEYTSLPVAVLSGPTHAEEVINDLPTAIVIASPDRELAERIQDIMMSATFRVYTNPDMVGVEMGGAVKNIMAVASGIADGLGYGDNTRSALITRGLHEMSRLGVAFGGKLLTFAGLAGMGDLVVTCTSMHSRNRRFGIKIGSGLKKEEALESMNQVVEGVKTTRAVYDLYQNREFDFDLPITRQVYQVLFNNKDPFQAVNDLMMRGPKHEIEEVVEDLNW